MRFEDREFEGGWASHGQSAPPWLELEGEGPPFPRAPNELSFEAYRDFEWEGEVPLGGAALAQAVDVNRRAARTIGWGCVVAGRVTPIVELRNFLGLTGAVTEEDLARAIARWQQGAHLTPDGQLGSSTWQRMMSASPPVLPRTRFAPASWPVVFNGRTLGVLEKITPYRRCFYDAGNDTCRSSSNGSAGERGGSNIELGFRVTDMSAVRAAGFVDLAGEDQFRWVQVVELSHVRSATAPTGFVRRHTRVIDPTTLVGAVPDLHPYYWDETTPLGSSPRFLNSNFTNRPSRDPSSNRLCYDLLFEDGPAFFLSRATPGHRAYFNFEVALVGVRAGTPTRNVVLNTVLWGFDFVVQPGGAVDVRMNALRAGVTGGSPAFRRVISRDINRGLFPNHCFFGGEMTGTARCS